MIFTRRGFLGANMTAHGETTPTEVSYPLRIRFWYVVHNQAERLWHWVWRVKLSPFHEAERAKITPPPSTYRFVGIQLATDEERARGITEKRVYIGRR